MAVFLGGLALLGLSPGPHMVRQDLDITYTIVWSLALANVFGAGACLLLSSQIAKLTTIRYGFLAPFMLVLILFAAFQATRDWSDLIALFIFGALGTFMKRYGWSRPALLIGFFLSDRIETSLYQSIQVYGFSFFERPIVIVLLILTAASVIGAIRYNPNAGKPIPRIARRRPAENGRRSASRCSCSPLSWSPFWMGSATRRWGEYSRSRSESSAFFSPFRC